MLKFFVNLCSAIVLVFCVFSSAYVAVAAGGELISPLNVIYAESLPNSKEEGTPRGNFKAIFKKFDSIDDSETDDESKNKKADELAIKYGYGLMPKPLLVGILDKLKAEGVDAAALVFSNLRKPEQLEELRAAIAEKHKPHKGRTPYTISLLPYQTIMSDEGHVTLWIGAMFSDGVKNKKTTLDYITVVLGEGEPKFDIKAGERVAEVLIHSLNNNALLEK